MNSDIEIMFGFINCNVTRELMITSYWALNESNLWNWLKNYVVDKNKGFVFADEPEIMEILRLMESEKTPYRYSHSGASFGFVMNNLNYIAKNGFEAYKTLYLSKHN